MVFPVGVFGDVPKQQEGLLSNRTRAIGFFFVPLIQLYCWLEIFFGDKLDKWLSGYSRVKDEEKNE